MSNTTDVLMVGGSANGVMVNVPRPMPPLIDMSEPGHLYRPQIFADPLTGVKFWIAKPDDVPLPEPTIILSMLLTHGMSPSWDLIE